MVGEGGERCGVGLRGGAGLGSLQAGCDADVSLALFVGLGPGQAVGFGDAGDSAGGLNQVEGFFDLLRVGRGWAGLRWGCPRGGQPGVCPGDAGLCGIRG